MHSTTNQLSEIILDQLEPGQREMLESIETNDTIKAAIKYVHNVVSFAKFDCKHCGKKFKRYGFPEHKIREPQATNEAIRYLNELEFHLFGKCKNDCKSQENK